MRRACVVAGVLGILAWFYAPAGARDLKGLIPPAPPQPRKAAAKGVRQNVKVQRAIAVRNGVVVEDPNKTQGMTDAVTFPTDRKAKQSLKLAKDYVDEEAWGEAARVLQTLLETKEDILVEVADASGGRWASLWGEANRLIAGMPPKGREFYELQYGVRAKTRLAEAKKKGDPRLLADVAQRYMHTQAGTEATSLLGTYQLDRGKFTDAAACFRRLLDHEAADKLPPLTLFKAALAFRLAKDKASAEQAWNQLLKVAREGVRINGEMVPLDQLQEALNTSARDDLPSSPFDWATYKGNASRSAQGNGGPPFLEVKWSNPTILPNEDSVKQTRQWVEQAVKQAEERQQPVLPSFFPVAATVRTDTGIKPMLVYRTYWGVHAVNLQAEGKLEWYSPSYWSLQKIAEDQSKVAQLTQSVNLYMQAAPSFLFENSTVGTLTTDNSKVYVVDDLALPPHPASPQLQQLQWGGQVMSFGPLQDAVYHSRLQAFDLATGKILWELGGRGAGAGELADSYFLGPPLPLGGKLYVLTEKNTELRLVCLEPPREDKQPPTIGWIQTLANFRDRMLLDPGRRIQAAHLSFGDGIIVCPTNAGVLLGIDLLSHSFAWAYSYREDAPAQESSNNMNGRRMMPGMWPGQMNNHSLSADWKTSAPIIQDGKVVFTAPDAPSVHCLNLRDGKRLWKESRSDDLYLGGVYNGKVVLVGKSTCRALDLATGKQVWKKETGLPSGQGVASDNVYYLPLKSGTSKEPEVCSIDIDQGIILARTKSHQNEVPGNLLFYEGDVISQSVDRVTAYPQLRVRLAQIDLALEKDPRNPALLSNRGELRLDKGDLVGAVEDLRTALANNPPAELLSRTRTKLFESFTELFQRDFVQASEKYLDQFKDLCRVPIPADATAEVRKKLEDEQQRREANYLCLLAKGREQQGRLSEAFQAYLDFSALSNNRELVSVVDEPAVKARPDVWAQGRIAAMVARATPEQRKPLEDRIAEQWRSIRATNDTAALRQFVAVFGSLFTVGKEARLYLAERLIQENVFLEAELHLLQLRRQADTAMAARAVEALARLMIRKGLLEDAAYWYRVLGRDFARTIIRDGKTGADFFNDLATDKRFLPYLDDRPQAWAPSARFKVRELHGNNSIQQMFVFEPEGEQLPFFQGNRLVLNAGTYQVRLLDRTTNEARWWDNLAGAANVNLAYLNGNFGNSRLPYHLMGHMIVLNVGAMVYAFDPVDKQKLWEKNLFGGAGPHQMMPISKDGDGAILVHYPEGFTRRLGQTGPVEPSYVCLHSRDGLEALDPLRGTVLWRKADVPLRTQIFGDDDHVYLVEMRPNGGAGAGRALRARDGVSVDVPDFASLYEKRLRILGRNLLVKEALPQGKGLVLRLYDVLTGKDLWSKTFAADAVVLNSDDPHLTGVAEPKEGGKVTVVDLRSLQEVLVTRVDPKDLDKVDEVHLVRDDQQYFVLCHKPAEAVANPWGMQPMGVWASVNGMRWVPVNGKVYAFQRASGKLNWRADVANQMLVLDQFQDLPVMLFTSQYYKMAGGVNMRMGRQTQVAAVKSIDKRTGKLLFDKEFPNNQNPFYALRSNPRAGTIELVGFQLRIQHYLEGQEPKAEADRGARQGVQFGTLAAPVRIRAIDKALPAK
jgi:outer membrane protein assembly factor BamB